MSRLEQTAIAFDQLVNELIANGMADETISARAYRNRNKEGWAWASPLLNGLFFWQEDHCRSAYESEVLRKHLPMEYRQ